jgi:arabinose-5-phosphate isomerase
MVSKISKMLVESMVIEKKAIELLIEQTQVQYDNVIEILLNCEGKVVFVGVGKSGHIGRKLSATFSSTGTPSFFVHGTEAVHGDLGMIEKKDIVILISNSGSTKEVIQNVPFLNEIGCLTIALVSNSESQLAKICDHIILIPKYIEADHLNLAPTSSSTITLVLGDAIACTLSKLKKFSKKSFYKFHPGGMIGEKLLGGKNE